MSILNSTEITKAQEIINNTKPGIYELKVLYGLQWQDIGSKTTFGKRFKETVLKGYLQNIRLLEPTKTNNHYTYEIIKGTSLDN